MAKKLTIEIDKFVLAALLEVYGEWYVTELNSAYQTGMNTGTVAALLIHTLMERVREKGRQDAYGLKLDLPTAVALFDMTSLVLTRDPWVAGLVVELREQLHKWIGAQWVQVRATLPEVPLRMINDK